MHSLGFKMDYNFINRHVYLVGRFVLLRNYVIYEYMYWYLIW